MNVGWSAEALGDLVALRVYISQHDSVAAERIVLQIVQSIERLSDHPHIGRPGRIPGTRELVIAQTPYIVPYRVRNNRIQVLRVYHAARRWPDGL